MFANLKSKILRLPREDRWYPARLHITHDIVDAIEALAYASPGLETGGVIGGRNSDRSRYLVISRASEPGPNAVRERAFFSRDTEYCQKIIDSWAEQSAGDIDYLGEWHKHEQANPVPSALDIRTMSEIAKSENYHISVPILLIIGSDNSSRSLRAFAINSEAKVLTIGWELVQ